MVCPSFFLPSGSWRDWHIRRAEGNREVMRAFALPPCGAVGGTTYLDDTEPAQGSHIREKLVAVTVSWRVSGVVLCGMENTQR